MEYSVWTWRWTNESFPVLAMGSGCSSRVEIGRATAALVGAPGEVPAVLLGKDASLRDR
jgi:hypothetical protein